MPERASASDPIASRVLPALTLALHLATTRGYGYFRDELYYLANGEHLSWGYVEHPPFIGVVAAVVRAVLGTSLFAIRFLPAVASAATVALAVASARRLGGGRFAQLLAGLATMFTPVFLALGSILSMNVFDLLFWAACFWVVIRVLDGQDERWWLAFGALAGLGLENKISVLFLGFGLAMGIVLDRRWEVLRSRWFWLGALLSGALFAPYVVWQHARGWPMLEFMDNARRMKNVAIGPLAFVREQFMQVDPLAAPVWLSGLAFFLLVPEGRRFRPLGWAYLTILGTMIVAGNAKPYYLAPAYTVLFAGGAVAIELWTRRRATLALRTGIAAMVVAGGLLAMPLAKPVLSEDAFVAYVDVLGIRPGTDERHEMGRLPQFFADMHGWPELAEAVARAFAKLPEGDRAKACIFGQNYGEAGAIDLFGPHLGLPQAVSGHNSYFLWGPRACTGEVTLVIGDRRERLEELFTTVELGETHVCRDCMPFENHLPIWIARGLRAPLGELWPRVKLFI